MRPAQPRRSILRRAIAAVLLLELLAAVLLTGATAVHERGVRYAAFDATLRGRAAALLGAVGDADDPGDNVVLALRGLAIPPGDLFEVSEPGRGLLGRSREWPFAVVSQGFGAPTFEGRSHGRRYRGVALHGMRVVDPGEPDGGKPHRILILYASPTAQVRHEVWEAVRFYALTFVAVLLVSAAFLTWFLRRTLAPLRALTASAAAVASPVWRFHPPPSAGRWEELAPLSDAMEATIRRLQRSFEQQRRLTSDAAHELKTDVAIIKSSLQLLAMRSRSAKEYRAGLGRSLADCERIEQTVGEMLALARLEHEAMVPAQESADLAVCAQAAASALASMAAVHGVRFELARLDRFPVSLRARDAGLLCTNLMENAVQHSLAGGAVVVSVRSERAFAILEVRDTGEGIEPRALPHIFEPFFRADEARARKQGGTGLGLAICKAICEKGGGAITAASEPGRGTRMTVRLPLLAAPPAVEELERVRSAAGKV